MVVDDFSVVTYRVFVFVLRSQVTNKTFFLYGTFVILGLMNRLGMSGGDV